MTAIIFLVAFLASNIIMAQLASYRILGSKGTVEALGVGVYWDADCTNPAYTLDWGTVKPDTKINKTVYIRNEGNQPSTINLTTENWDPPNASNFITLNWDYNGYKLNPKETTQVTLTLSTSPSIEGITNFTFNIVISINKQT